MQNDVGASKRVLRRSRYLYLGRKWASVLRSLIKKKRGIRLLKRKVHPDEPRFVKVYEGLAKDIERHRNASNKMRRKFSADLTIKTFVMKRESSSKCLRGDTEAGALRWLNQRRCRHVPKLLCSYNMTNARRRRKQVVVMGKIRGVVLIEYYHSLPKDVRNKIVEAFRIAVRAVADCQVFNGSPHLRNVMYNKKLNKCYIIDFERAEFGEVPELKLRPSYWGF